MVSYEETKKRKRNNKARIIVQAYSDYVNPRAIYNDGHLATN
jgi:hypothetical protein